MGNVSSGSAFVFPLGEAQRRASRISADGQSTRERIVLLKTWILPCVQLTARVYFPSNITIRAPRHVYQTALGVDSWGVTLDNLAQLRELGGTNSPSRKCGSTHSLGRPSTNSYNPLMSSRLNSSLNFEGAATHTESA